MSAACEKQTSFVSCLAPRTHELPELLMFSLSSNPDQLHQLCGAVTLRLVHLAFLLEDLSPPPDSYSSFQATSERQSRAQESQDDRSSLFVDVPICQNSTRALLGYKKKRFINSQKGLHLEKKKTRSIRAVKSDGTVKRGPQAEETGAPPTNHPLSPPTNIHFIH